MSDEVLVRASLIGKTYPDGTVALKGVDFEVKRGEIHGLLGENGAGKTTLTKILSGILKPTTGHLYVRGNEVNLRRPQDALALGIGMVHQNLALVKRFTAFENILLGTKENPRGRGADRLHDEIVALCEKVGLKVPLDGLVENLSLGVQQRVEIVKMLYREVDVLILDEPTSSLTPTGTDELFKTLRRIREEGKGMVFITHKLREVMEVCDKITVLRQGEVTGVTSSKESDKRALARMMVGRDIVLELRREPSTPGEPVLEVRSLTVLNNANVPAVKGVTFEVRRGEVFGIAGVEGNGQTELSEALSGIRPVKSGTVKLSGKDTTKASPRAIRSIGAALIPEDRGLTGLVMEMNLEENVILGKHREKQFSGGGISISWAKVTEFARSLIARFGIVAPGTKSAVKSLSGGNQQKVVVSRELSSEPDFILASQPTRGLDVASTEYMRKLLLNARNNRKGVLLVSADLDEVLQLSDRIGVMYEGEIIGVLPSDKATKESVGLLMGGVLD